MSIVKFLAAAIPGTGITAGGAITAVVGGVLGGASTAMGVVLVCAIAKHQFEKEYGVDPINVLLNSKDGSEVTEEKKTKEVKAEKVKDGNTKEGKKALENAKEVES